MHVYVMECKRGFLRKYKFYVIAANRFDALARATTLITNRKDSALQIDTLRVVRREESLYGKYA